MVWLTITKPRRLGKNSVALTDISLDLLFILAD